MHEESLRLVIITAAAVTLFINKESGKSTSREGEDEEKERKELAEKERKDTEGEKEREAKPEKRKYEYRRALLIKSKVGWSLPHPPGGLS